MSALAKLCLHMGIFVSGSDKSKSSLASELEHLGAQVFYKHSKKNVVGADLVVYTCAVGEDNEEVAFARQSGLKVFERADFLGQIAKLYKKVIAVAGSHGKTTVCAMIAKIFETAGLNPTVIVGGETAEGNLKIGAKDILIVEACEYREHFLKIPHNLGVIVNIDYDHPDYFKTETEYIRAFAQFAKNSKDGVVASEKYSILLPQNITTYGAGGNFQARHINYMLGKTSFDVYKNGAWLANISLNMIGYYNVSNALCAISVADFFGVGIENIRLGLEKFDGVKRRYEYMGKLNGNGVIADYAHHPTQIEMCIDATREIYNKDIVVVFEPHTYSRTKRFMPKFASALSKANKVFVLPTYSAREKKIVGATAKDLFEMLKRTNCRAKYFKSYKSCLSALKLQKNCVILILGAGSVIKLAESIKKQYLHLTNF